MIHGRSIEGKSLRIEKFSTGYRGNSLAYGMTRAELEELQSGAKVLPSSSTTKESRLLSKMKGRKRKSFPVPTGNETQVRASLSAPDKAPRAEKSKSAPKALPRLRRRAALTNAA
jgi:hypothetical protein